MDDRRPIKALPQRSGAASSTPPTDEIQGLPLPASSLPHELLTFIFQQLDVSDLYSCHLVCKAWRQAGRDDIVLRQLCTRRGYAIRGAKQLHEVVAPYLKKARSNRSDGHSHSLFRLRGRDEMDAASWEELLKRGHILHRIKFPPSFDPVDLASCPPIQGVLKGYSNRAKLHTSDIWRVKIDPIDNVMITTSFEGGLRVLDLEDGRQLWCDPSVRARANLDYRNGWLVHDCPIVGPGGVHFQVLKFDRLASKSSQELPRRGVLVPVCSISCQFSPEAFRLRCPHLAVAGDDDVAFYDLASGKLVKHFKPSFENAIGWHVRCIDFDKDFIFLLAIPWEWPSDDDGSLFDSNSEEDEDEPERGLFVFENSKEGKLIYNDSLCKLVCSSSWDLDGHGMDDFRYDGQTLQECPGTGIATSMQPGAPGERWQYTQTAWCGKVMIDSSTESLVLCGLGTLLIIPTYKQAFKRVQKAIATTHRPRIRTIGVGTGCSQEGSAQLAVSNGKAAFIASTHHLPIWVDLRSLLQADRNKLAPPPRAATLCLGQEVLNDCSGFVFETTSCLQMNETKLVVVCDFFKEVTRYTRAPYSVAVVMDFGKLLDAKLANPDAPILQKPSTTTIQLYPRTVTDEKERARWRSRRNGNPDSRVILPDGAQRLLRAWAPRRLAGYHPDAEVLASPLHHYSLTPDGRLLKAEVWTGRRAYESESDDDEEDWSSDEESSEEESSEGNSSGEDSSGETDESRKTSSGSGAGEEAGSRAGSNDEGQGEAAENGAAEEGSDGRGQAEAAASDDVAQEDLCTKIAALSTGKGDKERGGA